MASRTLMAAVEGFGVRYEARAPHAVVDASQQEDTVAVACRRHRLL
jgi:hypothetical protein